MENIDQFLHEFQPSCRQSLMLQAKVFNVTTLCSIEKIKETLKLLV